VPMRLWVRQKPLAVEPTIARVIREECGPTITITELSRAA